MDCPQDCAECPYEFCLDEEDRPVGLTEED